MIELVNGYVCHNCAEAALAKQGKDPDAKPGDPPNGADKVKKISAFADQPATVLDGALKGLLTANPAAAVSPSDPSKAPAVKTSGIDLTI